MSMDNHWPRQFVLKDPLTANCEFGLTSYPSLSSALVAGGVHICVSHNIITCLIFGGK